MKTILYSGYAYTGGTILGELFREIDSYLVLPGKEKGNMEFRLIKERFGLCDLEDAIFSRDPEIIDLAIKDFLWLCKNFARDNKRFSKPGYSYQSRSGNTFHAATNEYVTSLTDFEYPMDWHFYDFKRSLPTVLIKKTLKKLINNQKIFRKKAYMAYPSFDEFNSNTIIYIEKIMKGFLQELSENNEENIVLPKSIPLFSYKKVMQTISYFNESKILIIDRDPRDVFYEIVSSGRDRYIPIRGTIKDRVSGFSKFYKSIRKEQSKINDLDEVLLIKFEDMCLSYNDSIEMIYKFCEIDAQMHKEKKKKRFNPDISKKNVYKWKNDYSNNRNIYDFLESELHEYIY